MSNQIESYLKAKLNDEQYLAAMYTEGHSLILAWAGSGKTRTLTYKIANLIYGKWVHPSRILAVTFTNKAAQEMKERLQTIMSDLRDGGAWSTWSSAEEDGPPLVDENAWGALAPDFDFDQLIGTEGSSSSTSAAWSLPHYHWRDYQRIGTFHSVFLKLLKEDIEHLGKAYNKQFTVYDSNDSDALTRTLLKQHNMTDRVELKEARGKISSRKNGALNPSQAAHQCETQMDERILHIYESYQKALEEANAVDFDDLLLLPKELFVHNPEILRKRQQKFQYILVDEAQDTNAIQFELMRLLVGEKGNITFIGDDYQSIYRRRGAVMDNFLRVDKRRPDIRTFKLETNYRSKPHIVEAGNAIILNNQKQYEKNVVAHRTGSDKIRIFTFADEIDEAIQVIDLITKLKEEAGLLWADFTILYRTNAQSSPFEQILLTEGIPYKVVGAFKFFERVEIKDILSYVRYLLNPKDTVSLKRIINTPKRSIGQTTIDQIEQMAFQLDMPFSDLIASIDTYGKDIPAGTRGKISLFNTLLEDLKRNVAQSTPAELVEHIVKATGYKAYVLKVDGEEKGKERMENIGQLVNIASRYEGVWLDALYQLMEEISLMTSLEDTSVEQADAVKLMTVHSSKWLEFPYVFITWLEEGIFPLPKAKFDNEELEEERRGMYVAITRAKDHLFLSHATSRQQRGQIKYNPPSRFLDEIPMELLKRYDLAWKWQRSSGPSRDEGDRIKHKLFWPGTVLEVWDKIVIVKFDNPKFGVRKLEWRFLSAE